ncbi:MAG TPA: AbrB/MazE/SpoVT family DNA-binding domain-containing protein [Candidatus Lokiarchaeia archaeon]|nr:AbrB/MazE/SpoVT family DNA-binding domain-containing protein [Candidatus Lokiarchaeia archaeon]
MKTLEENLPSREIETHGIVISITSYARNNTIFLVRIMVAGKVGSKGELFVPKEIREKLDLKAGQKITFRVHKGRLIVEKIPTVEELLSKPGKVTATMEEIKENRKELSEAMEK